jgi:uroporphyrinogen-III decarboxylase
MGYPARPVLEKLPRPGEVATPPLRETERTAGLADFLERCGDRYRLATLDLSGFTVYTLLRGFENSMEDLLGAPHEFASLFDVILAFECDLIRLAARHGFDGVHFADDWGTQTGLMISPALWRRVFQPRYQRQFELTHELGLHVWFHCCGNITQICPDLHEAGVDVLNISQPNVVDIDELGRRLRGKQCFMTPISYQTVSVQGTPAQIYAEAERLWERLGTNRGGLVGYVEEYGCMGMSEENYRACAEAFRRLRPASRLTYRHSTSGYAKPEP